MQVVFRTRKLQRQYANSADAVRAYGRDIGRKYIQRIDQLLAAASEQDLYALRSLRYHALTGDRGGQHAIDLTGNVRLIVTTDRAKDTVTIETVEDYH